MDEDLGYALKRPHHRFVVLQKRNILSGLALRPLFVILRVLVGAFSLRVLEEYAYPIPFPLWFVVAF